jgi:low affinity Fe/Cu permease
VSTFDRFACWVSAITARAPFFACCVLLVVVWAPSYFLFGSLDTWQLVINTVTTIVTFLLVALLQNSSKRSDDAQQQKLNAIADFLADLAGHVGMDDRHVRELREAVGIENEISA